MDRKDSSQKVAQPQYLTKQQLNRLDFLGEKATQENQTPNSEATNGAGANVTSELKGGPKVDKADESKINGNTDGPSVSAPQ
jgi:hypothetical protein